MDVASKIAPDRCFAGRDLRGTIDLVIGFMALVVFYARAFSSNLPASLHRRLGFDVIVER